MTHTPPHSGVPGRRTVAWALAALLACAGAQAQTAGGRAPSRSGDFIVAVVNTELVTSVELQQRLDRIQADMLALLRGVKPEASFEEAAH